MDECIVSCLIFFFFLMIRRPPRSTQGVSSAASDVYKRQLYKSLKRAISVRKAYEIWNTGYRDIWHEKDLLVFGRGKVLVAVTNNPKGIDKEIIIWDKEKFPEETVLCDALEEWKKTCVKVKNRKIHLKMHEQKPRIFVPSDS
eukprot:TRINITY_DN2693_c0_g1_i5.p2 TRINITY_DN2693_c0_g1~~TRINITY_DN2693_c0_g1_i5.p2  ORF type:complete len:143 (-),score=32.46 TRINITY_DN2693_c0_g1_i5:168-596(-)